MSFSSYRKPGRIAMLHASALSQADWRKWALAQKLDVTTSWSGKQKTSFDFHMTVIASAEPVAMEPYSTQIAPITLRPVTLDRLGKATVAMFVQDERVLAIRNAMIEAGFVSTFPNFLPHVSVSYKSVELNHVTLPPSITFDRLSVKPFSPD